MTTHTHGLASNWQLYSTLADDRFADEDIERFLTRMDGEESWGLSLWRLPEGSPVRGLNREGAKEFLQSAGNAKAMSIEMMVHEPRDGEEYSLYAIGKPVDGEPSDTTISWQDQSIPVKTNEVFDADEATKIYQHYRQHDDVPGGCTRRFIGAFPEPQ